MAKKLQYINLDHVWTRMIRAVDRHNGQDSFDGDDMHNIFEFIHGLRDVAKAAEKLHGVSMPIDLRVKLSAAIERLPNNWDEGMGE